MEKDKISELHQHLRKQLVSRHRIVDGKLQNVVFNFALQPAIIPKQTYETLCRYSYLWQKLIALSSLNHELIHRIMSEQKDGDDFVGKTYELYCNDAIYNHEVKKPQLALCRYDFFIDKNVPKLIQYNLVSVSMTGIASKFQQVYKERFSENKNILENECLLTYAKGIVDFYKIFKIDGIFLAVILKNQCNASDQEILFKKIQDLSQQQQRPLKCYRVDQNEFLSKTHLNENKQLIFQEKKVGVVYFRAGYSSNTSLQETIKERVCESSAVSIPWIGGDLMNTKRMQTQISKQSIMSQYLTSEQTKQLRCSVIQSWDFSQNHNNEEQIQKLLKFIQQEGKQKFILKPNEEGGGHNLFGEEGYNKLVSLSANERQKYILMRRLVPESHQATIINSVSESQFSSEQETIDSEFSIYGSYFTNEKGELIENNIGGFLIRSKQVKNNEGGLLGGNGLLSALQISQN